MHQARLFFFTDPPTTEIYTLSLHDALPISGSTDDRAAVAAGDPRVAPAHAIPRPRRAPPRRDAAGAPVRDRKSTRLNSSHVEISYAVFCLKKKKKEGKLPQDVMVRGGARTS